MLLDFCWGELGVTSMQVGVWVSFPCECLEVSKDSISVTGEERLAELLPSQSSPCCLILKGLVTQFTQLFALSLSSTVQSGEGREVGCLLLLLLFPFILQSSKIGGRQWKVA
jgi:hypothetical protein